MKDPKSAIVVTGYALPGRFFALHFLTERLIMLRYLPLPLLLAMLLASCGTGSSTGTDPKANTAPHTPLLSSVPREQSGISFNNAITESPELNYFTYVYAYNGAGVAVGDIDNDGLQDIYFTGNQVSDKLYRNLGGMKFADITEKAIGPKAQEGWRTGVSMATWTLTGSWTSTCAAAASRAIHRSPPTCST